MLQIEEKVSKSQAIGSIKMYSQLDVSIKMNCKVRKLTLQFFVFVFKDYLIIQFAQIFSILQKMLAKYKVYVLKVIHKNKPENLMKSSYTRSYSRYPQENKGF